MTRVFASWSGGKDCCLALYRASISGMDIRYLANTITGDGQRSCSHGISAAVIKKQAEALGIPIMQRRTTGDTYEAEFINMLKAFKSEGIEGGVFGDIDFNAHREWIDRVCSKVSIIPHLPLWLENQKKLLEEFIDAGFIAVVVAAKVDFFGEEILGKQIDKTFLAHIEELRKTKDITHCGEAGEYHSLVIDGPIFKQRLEITESKKILKNNIWFLNVLNTELKSKQPVERR